jgi:hypothetical protein
VRPELVFVPGVKEDFDRICAVFDSCDEWMVNGPLADGYQWVLERLDFRFDQQFRADAAAARSQGHFDEFVRAARMHVDALMKRDI